MEHLYDVRVALDLQSQGKFEVGMFNAIGSWSQRVDRLFLYERVLTVRIPDLLVLPPSGTSRVSGYSRSHCRG